MKQNNKQLAPLQERQVDILYGVCAVLDRLNRAIIYDDALLAIGLPARWPERNQINPLLYAVNERAGRSLTHVIVASSGDLGPGYYECMARLGLEPRPAPAVLR